jgi:hypothetical protein
MERIEKTVFISYRRTNIPWALAIFQNLTQHGYDVFFDYTDIASGDFERISWSCSLPPRWSAATNRRAGYVAR